MSVRKSILEDIELSTGTQIYVQISDSGRASLSVDNTEFSHALWLTTDELKKLSEAINKALEDHTNG